MRESVFCKVQKNGEFGAQSVIRVAGLVVDVYGKVTEVRCLVKGNLTHLFNSPSRNDLANGYQKHCTIYDI